MTSHGQLTKRVETKLRHSRSLLTVRKISREFQRLHMDRVIKQMARNIFSHCTYVQTYKKQKTFSNVITMTCSASHVFRLNVQYNATLEGYIKVSGSHLALSILL